MTTEGPSDTVLTSHGSADPGAVLAWTTTAAAPPTARIARKLQPGEYWLSVRQRHWGLFCGRHYRG